MNKILEGAKQALAIARGEELPASITQFGFMLWSVDHGFVGQLAKTETDAAQTASYLSFPVAIVRVRVSTILNGDRGVGA